MQFLLSLPVVISRMGIKTRIPRMPLVLFGGNPLKVFGSVIKSISVLVVNLGEFVGIGNKSLRNETVNEKLLALSFLVQHDHFVSMTYKPWTQVATFRAFVAWLRPYLSSWARKVVSFVSFDGFHKEIIPTVFKQSTSPIMFIFAPNP